MIQQKPWEKYQQQTGPITLGTPDPAQAYKAPTAAAGLVKAQADANTATATAPYAGPTAKARLTKEQADAQVAAAAARDAALKDANKPDPAMAKVQSQFDNDDMLTAIDNARTYLNAGHSAGNFFGTSGFQGIPLIGQNSTDLANALSTIGGKTVLAKLQAMKDASTTGASGLGRLTNMEAGFLRDSISSLGQEQSPDRLRTNLAQVELHYRRLNAMANGENPNDPQVAKKYGIAVVPPVSQGVGGAGGAGGSGGATPGAPPPTGGAPNGGSPSTPPGLSSPPNGNEMQLTSAGSYQTDPALAGVSGTVRGMIKAGHSAPDIRSYLNRIKPGLGDKVTGIEDAVTYSRQHPGWTPNVNDSLEKNWVPNGGLSRMMGNIGMSEPGSAVVGAADMMSLGLLDNLTSDPEMTRGVMSGLKERNPTSYLLGQIGGAAIPSIGFEAGLGKLGLSGLNAVRGGDLVSGALYSAGSADDPSQSRIENALIGGATGVVGGMAGRGAGRFVGRVGTGIRDTAQQYLHDAGVSMTPGQIATGWLKSAEDKMTSWPFVGDQIGARRVDGIKSFNQAAFDQGLAPANATTGGVVAEPGIDIARRVRGQTYDNALDGVNVTADAPFQQDMSATIAAGQRLPEPMRTNMDYTLPTRIGQAFDDQGNLTGHDYQQALRGLRGDVSSVSAQPYGSDFADVARQGEGALEGILTRQSPETVGALRTANEVNRNVETLRDATNRARNGSRTKMPGYFMPSQLADAGAASAKKFGNSHGTTNQPFYDLTRAGQEILPSSVPDSGTAGRLLLPTVAGALAGGGSYAAHDLGDDNGGGEQHGGGIKNSLGTAAIVAALAAAPYSKPAQKIIQDALLAERPKAAARIGQYIYDKNGIAGLLARTPALTYMTGQ